MSKRIFIIAALFLCFSAGVMVGKFKVFPYSLFHYANSGLQRILDETGLKHTVWGYTELPKDLQGKKGMHLLSEGVQEGINLVSEMGPEYSLLVKATTLNGKVLHSWNLNCFELWKDFSHLDESIRPKTEPGTFVHGMVLLPDGSLVFNHEFVGLTRIAKDQTVLWQLPYLTHHSLHLHEDNTLWVCGKKYLNQVNGFKNDKPAQWKYVFLQISMEGKVLNEWVIDDVLLENEYGGIIDMLQGKGGQMNEFHMNDVEPIPDSLTGSAFSKGDVVVSLRDINTVFVYNVLSAKISYMLNGKFVRQHDPDFISKDVLSIFDNKNAAYPLGSQKSRILHYYPLKDSFVTVFEGSEAFKFMTSQAGKHSYLPNGNLLISETRRGRAFEVDKAGNIVWEYVNLIDENEVGFVIEVQRLPNSWGDIFAKE